MVCPIRASAHSPPQMPETRTSHVKKDSNLEVNCVTAIGHGMIFVYTVSTKLGSTSWGLTSVVTKHTAISITKGLHLLLMQCI